METSGLEQQLAEPEFAAWVGIDWADQKHFWSLQEAGSERRERGELQHIPEAVEGLGSGAEVALWPSSHRCSHRTNARGAGIYAQ